MRLCVFSILIIGVGMLYNLFRGAAQALPLTPDRGLEALHVQGTMLEPGVRWKKMVMGWDDIFLYESNSPISTAEFMI